VGYEYAQGARTDMAEPSVPAHFASVRVAISGRIDAACSRARRDPAGVTLVAVSKTVPAAAVAGAVAAGFTTLGESRVQEAEAKIPLVPGARWHLVGHLQGNKARPALELFDVVQTVDSIDLARRLDRVAGDVPGARFAGNALRPNRYPILLQVNVDADPAKAGFSPDVVEALLPELVALPHLDVRGLMTVGLFVATPDEARSTFVSLRELSERLRLDEPRLGPELSMGMTDDFEVAVEEGATIIRVGRAIFGERPTEGR
jgi:PLP dependent protein